MKDGKIIKPVMDAIMDDLKHGFYMDDYTIDESDNIIRIGDTPHQITNLTYLPPETITSNMTANKFGLHYSETL
jgi:hypothetical protein